MNSPGKIGDSLGSQYNEIVLWLRDEATTGPIPVALRAPQLSPELNPTLCG